MRERKEKQKIGNKQKNLKSGVRQIVPLAFRNALPIMQCNSVGTTN